MMRTDPPPNPLIRTIAFAIDGANNERAAFALCCCLAAYLDRLPPQYRASCLTSLEAGQTLFDAPPIH
jgi:hypothetical protein